MNRTPAAVAAHQYTAYVHNCIRNASCELSFLAPLPGLPYLQLYVPFGSERPTTQEFVLVDLCTGNQQPIVSSNYIIGQDPEGNWYGVFKNFNTSADVTSFVIWFSSIVFTGAAYVERTFFSEALIIEPCLPLTKIKACHPEQATTTGFDINGVYYGLPVDEDEAMGNPGVRYFHIAYVRLGKVRELSNKATFKSSIYRNFRTTVEKIHQLETELVPKWYKDELLAIYARGAISVNDGPTFLVSDLAIEPINEDDLTWKPFAQLKETFRLYFGCDESECIECCSPVVIIGGSSVTEEGIYDMEFNEVFA